MKCYFFGSGIKNGGFYYRPNPDFIDQRLFACGIYCTGDLQTHFIHVVLAC